MSTLYTPLQDRRNVVSLRFGCTLLANFNLVWHLANSPELLTRHDLKVYLPPIGGLTVYIFGKPEYISDESKELTLRVHDECNGSDVFGMAHILR